MTIAEVAPDHYVPLRGQRVKALKEDGTLVVGRLEDFYRVGKKIRGTVNNHFVVDVLGLNTEGLPETPVAKDWREYRNWGLAFLVLLPGLLVGALGSLAGIVALLRCFLGAVR